MVWYNIDIKIKRVIKMITKYQITAKQVAELEKATQRKQG
jgi:hypothetical protein